MYVHLAIYIVRQNLIEPDNSYIAWLYLVYIFKCRYAIARLLSVDSSHSPLHVY